MPSSSTGSHAGIFASLGQVDALDVEEAAEHRVGAAGDHRRQQVEPDVDLVDVIGGEPLLVEDRVQEGRLVRDAGGGDRLAAQVGDVCDPGLLGSEISEVSGCGTSAADGGHRQALVAREHHLGLVGDRQVDLAGGHLLDRRRGIGGDLRLDVETGLLEVAALERREEAGVVGVDVEVERDGERLGPAAPRRPPSRRSPSASAASNGRDGDREGACRPEPSNHDRRFLPRSPASRYVAPTTRLVARAG